MDQPTTLDRYPSRAMFDDIFKVEVGSLLNKNDDSEPPTFYLYKGIVSFYSGFFQAATKTDTFIEGKDKCVKLPEEDPDDFREFVAFMNLREHYEDNERNERPSQLVRIWVLADRYLCPLLSNLAIDLIIKRTYYRNRISTGPVKYIYENTTDRCTLRRLFACISTFSNHKLPHVFAKHRQLYPDAALPADAFEDIIIAMCDYSTLISNFKTWPARMRALSPCEFHIHNEGEECPKGHSYQGAGMERVDIEKTATKLPNTGANAASTPPWDRTSRFVMVPNN